MSGAGPLVCWLLSDGAPGHESQSEGVLDSLAGPQQRSRVLLKVRSEFWRRLGRVLLQLHLPLPWRLLTLAYELDIPAGAPPRLVVASGGNTLLACALIARHYGAVSVYSGTLKNYPAHSVDLVISVTPQPGNNLRLPVGPVPRVVSAVAELPPGEHLVLLVGGATREYPYSPADWRALAAGMRALSARSGRRWLLTTSRRTGTEAEDILAAELPADCIAERVFWGREPKRVLRDFLARGAQVFVTEDSLTMVGEAIWSARPVVSVGLAHAVPSDNDAEALAGFVRDGLLQRITCATLGEARLETGRRELPPMRANIDRTITALLQRKEAS